MPNASHFLRPKTPIGRTSEQRRRRSNATDVIMYVCQQHTAATLVAAVILFGPVVALGQEKITLRPNWSPGHTTYVEFTWDNDDLETGSDHPPEGSRRHTVITHGYLHTVDGPTSTAGVAVTLEFARLAYSFESGQTQLAFDTDTDKGSKPTNWLGRSLTSLLGKTIKLELDKTGRVIAVAGAEELLEHIEPPDGPETESLFAILCALLSSGTQPGIWEPFYGCFAFADVTVGSAWHRTLQDLQGRDDSHLSCTLDKLETRDGHRKAMISYTLEQPEPDDWHTGPSGLLIKSGPYKLEGSAVVDLDRSEIESAHEQVHEQVKSAAKDRSGKIVWWTTAQSSARHRIRVLSPEARRKERQEHEE